MTELMPGNHPELKGSQEQIVEMEQVLYRLENDGNSPVNSFDGSEEKPEQVEVNDDDDKVDAVTEQSIVDKAQDRMVSKVEDSEELIATKEYTSGEEVKTIKADEVVLERKDETTRDTKFIVQENAFLCPTPTYTQDSPQDCSHCSSINDAIARDSATKRSNEKGTPLFIEDPNHSIEPSVPKSVSQYFSDTNISDEEEEDKEDKENKETETKNLRLSVLSDNPKKASFPSTDEMVAQTLNQLDRDMVLLDSAGLAVVINCDCICKHDPTREPINTLPIITPTVVSEL